MSSVEFHPEAEDEFISAARFYEDQTTGLGLDFIRMVQGTSNDYSNPHAVARRLAIGSGVCSSRSFRTVFCIASSLSASTSLRSRTSGVGRGIGGTGSDALLPNNRLERPGSTPAAHPV